MIVLVKHGGKIVKTFIRDRVFNEVNDANKKIDGATLRSSNIESVLWLEKGKFKEIPLQKWMALAEENDFWSIA